MPRPGNIETYTSICTFLLTLRAGAAGQGQPSWYKPGLRTATPCHFLINVNSVSKPMYLEQRLLNPCVVLGE